MDFKPTGNFPQTRRVIAAGMISNLLE